jgi:hypothetical protein
MVPFLASAISSQQKAFVAIAFGNLHLMVRFF